MRKDREHNTLCKMRERSVARESMQVNGDSPYRITNSLGAGAGPDSTPPLTPCS